MLLNTKYSFHKITVYRMGEREESFRVKVSERKAQREG
jgi:hypothetical protein